MPHGGHIYAKESDMAKAKMCAYPQSDHSLPHWKCVFRFCADCPCVGNQPISYYINCPMFGFQSLLPTI